MFVGASSSACIERLSASEVLIRGDSFLTVEYVVAAILALICKPNECYWLEPGTRYESRTPTQNPNWVR
jgi:hypothetical protein